MVKLAESEEGIPIEPDKLDQDHMLLNVRNGTLDLRTGELREHRREDLITKLAPVEYDPDAKCSLWEKTLKRNFAGDAKLIGFFQRLCGYFLTGDVSEKILPVCYGKGDNGKTTIFNTLYHMLGSDYAKETAQDLLLVKMGQSHPTELADLFGKRLVFSLESGEDRHFNEDLVKRLTGTDVINARRMREDSWDFVPTHKLVLATNHRPKIRGTDDAIWNRLREIPFTVQIPKKEQDRKLPEKLAKERSGILAWCLRGCLEWRRRKSLDPPDVVLTASAAYRASQDVLALFLEECCELDKNAEEKASRLHAAFCSWGGKLNPNEFGKALVERGFEKKPKNGIYYVGLKLPSKETQQSFLSKQDVLHIGTEVTEGVS
jgi:putative DNA primase/helicase